MLYFGNAVTVSTVLTVRNEELAVSHGNIGILDDDPLTFVVILILTGLSNDFLNAVTVFTVCSLRNSYGDGLGLAEVDSDYDIAVLIGRLIYRCNAVTVCAGSTVRYEENCILSTISVADNNLVSCNTILGSIVVYDIFNTVTVNTVDYIKLNLSAIAEGDGIGGLVSVFNMVNVSNGDTLAVLALSLNAGVNAFEIPVAVCADVVRHLCHYLKHTCVFAISNNGSCITILCKSSCKALCVLNVDLNALADRTCVNNIVFVKLKRCVKNNGYLSYVSHSEDSLSSAAGAGSCIGHHRLCRNVTINYKLDIRFSNSNNCICCRVNCVIACINCYRLRNYKCLSESNVTNEGNSSAHTRRINCLLKSCVVNAVYGCRTHTESNVTVIALNCEYSYRKVDCCNATGLLNKIKNGYVLITCKVSSINFYLSITKELGRSKKRCSINANVHILKIIYISLCAIYKNNFTNTLTVKCVSCAGCCYGNFGCVNDDSTVVSSIFTELNSSTGENRAVLENKLTAVTKVVSKGNSGIVNNYCAVRSCDAKLSKSCHHRILNVNNKCRIVAVSRLGKCELIGKLNNTVGKVKLKFTACNRVLARCIA